MCPSVKSSRSIPFSSASPEQTRVVPNGDDSELYAATSGYTPAHGWKAKIALACCFLAHRASHLPATQTLLHTFCNKSPSPLLVFYCSDDSHVKPSFKGFPPSRQQQLENFRQKRPISSFSFQQAAALLRPSGQIYQL